MASVKRGQNEGSIYRRHSDGRWVGAVSVPGGRRRYFYGATKTEVVRRVQAARRAIVAGAPLPSGRLKVADVLLDWLRAVEPTVRPSTFVSYEGHVRLHLAPVAGLPVDRLTPAIVRTLQARLLEDGLSPRTVGYTNTILRMAFRWAEEQGIVASNPATKVDPPRIARQAIHPLTPEDVRHLIEATPDATRRALYALQAGCGLRLGEALGLRWQDVDDRRLTVRYSLRPIPGQTRGERLQLVEPKTRASRRTLWMPDFVIDCLGALPRISDFVLSTPVGTPLDPRNSHRLFKADLERASLPVTVRLHDLRHTAATIMLSAGVDLVTVKEVLGHTSISTTAVYTHVVPAMREAAARTVNTSVDVNVAAYPASLVEYKHETD